MKFIRDFINGMKPVDPLAGQKVALDILQADVEETCALYGLTCSVEDLLDGSGCRQAVIKELPKCHLTLHPRSSSPRSNIINDLRRRVKQQDRDSLLSPLNQTIIDLGFPCLVKE